MANQVILRAGAQAQGLIRYFTGKPCKRGHVAERFVSNLTCIVCDYEKQKRAEWHKKNPERHNELTKQSYQRHRDARLAAARAAYDPEKERQRHLGVPVEVRRTRARAWYLKNQEKVRAYFAEWEKQNIEKKRERMVRVGHRRRAQKLSSPGQPTAADLREILKMQNHRCAYCRADLRKTKKNLDHIIPLARGGSNYRKNVQYTCGPCNQSKGARDPIAYAQMQGRLL